MKKLAILFALCLPALAQNYPPRSQSVISQPSVSAQATASVVAQDNIRHVADQACFSGGATTAPTATQLAVNLRDGATGAGTVIWTQTVTVPAAVGYNVPAVCFPINLAGSNATAMTLEWSAGLTNEFESVTLLYHNVAN